MVPLTQVAAPAPAPGPYFLLYVSLPYTTLSVLATSLPFSTNIWDYYSVPRRKCWVNKTKGEKKLLHPTIHIWARAICKSVAGVPLLPAREEWLSGKADCPGGMPAVHTSTYLFVFRKPAVPPLFPWNLTILLSCYSCPLLICVILTLQNIASLRIFFIITPITGTVSI